jgi:hypothetical protein
LLSVRFPEMRWSVLINRNLIRCIALIAPLRLKFECRLTSSTVVWPPNIANEALEIRRWFQQVKKLSHNWQKWLLE